MKRNPPNTDISNRRINNLSISVDYDENDNECVSFLFVPDMEKFDHYHIDLSMTEVRNLKKWISDFLELYDK